MADPVTWIMIATAAGGQIYAGAQADKAARANAALQEKQGQIANAEAQREAAKTVEEAQKFRDRQILAYMKSGVTLQGSPLLVLEDTIKKGDEEAAAIRKRGYATEDLYNANAKITRSTGKASFITGITGAAGTIGSAGITSGAFGSTKQTATGKGV